MPSITILLGAAVIDSINPCAFGVLLFLLAYLSKTSKNKVKMLIHGLTYIAAVFITYFLAGLILLPVIGSLGKASVWAYNVIGALVIVFGLLEIKDFFWYGKGFSLELLPGASKRIKMYSNKITDNVVSAFALGVFVALVELPCTGAVYLAVLSMMSLIGVNAATVSWLILYNLIFILPLVVILLVVWLGTNTKKLEHLRREHRGLMRLFIGLVLIGMGGWMIHFVNF